jgi:hypothetical protein
MSRMQTSLSQLRLAPGKHTSLVLYVGAGMPTQPGLPWHSGLGFDGMTHLHVQHVPTWPTFSFGPCWFTGWFWSSLRLLPAAVSAATLQSRKQMHSQIESC